MYMSFKNRLIEYVRDNFTDESTQYDIMEDIINTYDHGEFGFDISDKQFNNMVYSEAECLELITKLSNIIQNKSFNDITLNYVIALLVGYTYHIDMMVDDKPCSYYIKQILGIDKIKSYDSPSLSQLKEYAINKYDDSLL